MNHTCLTHSNDEHYLKWIELRRTSSVLTCGMNVTWKDAPPSSSTPLNMDGCTISLRLWWWCADASCVYASISTEPEVTQQEHDVLHAFTVLVHQVEVVQCQLGTVMKSQYCWHLISGKLAAGASTWHGTEGLLRRQQ